MKIFILLICLVLSLIHLGCYNNKQTRKNPPPPTTPTEPVNPGGPPIINKVKVSTGTYHPGSQVTFTVIFNKVVNVIQGHQGAPFLALTVGGQARQAIFDKEVHGASGSIHLAFIYTVQENDSDEDGISIEENKYAIQLNGGHIQDSFDQALINMIPSEYHTFPKIKVYRGESDLTSCSDPGTTGDALPGLGTAASPFVLCLPAHLELIGDTVTNSSYTMTAHYVMGKNIDFNNNAFIPISGSFNGILDGRGKKITNLKINRSSHAALFITLGTSGTIQDLGIEEFEISGSGRIGTLVATSSGIITNCYAVDSDSSVDISGGDSNSDIVGGLVGRQENGKITASYAISHAKGGSGELNSVGGLVGRQENGKITASYAVGNSHGGDGNNDYVGGLVGYMESGSITSSYAVGNSYGGDGNNDYVGGLVGYQNTGDIISSYATGDSNGEEGNNDYVGGLIGYQTDGNVTFSYTTGRSNGGKGSRDSIGSLIGYQTNGTITSSYGFGTPSNGGLSNNLGMPPAGVNLASQLNQVNSGDKNGSNRWPVIAWEFGTSQQTPALKYVDSYEEGDHDSNPNTPDTHAYTCTSTKAFSPLIYISCDETLLPGQVR